MPQKTSAVLTQYRTWYDFKRVLESKLGHALSVNLWLRVKPRNPLPWDESDLATSFAEVTKIKRSASGIDAFKAFRLS